MLTSLLSEYLDTAVSPDVKAIINDAHTLFDLFEVDGFEDVFIELLSDTDQVDSHVTAERILAQTRTYQEDLLRQHGVSVHEEVRLSQINVLLHGLHDIPAFLEGSLILERCSQDLSPEEIFAETVALVTGHSSESVIMWLETVSPALIATIATWVDRDDPVMDVELVRQKELRIEAFQWYVDKYDIHQLKLAYLIEHGLDVYHPAQLYLNVLGPDFNQLELDPLLHEFFAVALISSDYALRPAALIDEFAEHYLADVNMITQLTVKAHEVALVYAQEGPVFETGIPNTPHPVV